MHIKTLRKSEVSVRFFIIWAHKMRSAPVSHDTGAIMKNLSVKKHEIKSLAFLTVFIVTIKYE